MMGSQDHRTAGSHGEKSLSVSTHPNGVDSGLAPHRVIGMDRRCDRMILFSRRATVAVNATPALASFGPQVREIAARLPLQGATPQKTQTQPTLP